MEWLLQFVGSKGIAALVTLFYLLSLAHSAWKKAREALEARRPRPAPAPAPAPAVPRPRPAPPPGWEKARRELTGALEAITQRSRELGESVRRERANARFVPLLTEWIPARAADLRAALEEERGGSRALLEGVNGLAMVLDEAAELIRQRRDPALLPALGDADALAESCYAPIVTFARAEGLPLRAAAPVVRLSEFDLSIWTGFAPTSLAPIFLPPGFFHRVVDWPAVAHEVGHSFLVSVEGIDARLRAELGLPGEKVGSAPLRFEADGIAHSELVRVFGGWFEELFCDVFGTLMCGPAYLATAQELLAAKQDPREVLFAAVDPETGRFDPHPPAHLRVLLCAHVLGRAGLHAAAADLVQRWRQRHSLGEDTPLLFPAHDRGIFLPIEPFQEIGQAIVERLCGGPLRALNGFGLEQISGLDFGPFEHGECQRAKEAILAGRVPTVRDARAVIGGAVLAWLDRPPLEARILQLARAAIPAIGTHERRPDAAALPQGEAVSFDADAAIEALILREILDRPRRRTRGLRRGARRDV